MYNARMVKMIALYKRPADPAAFDKHYETVHKPLALKIPELAEFRSSKVIGGPAGKSPWYFMVELCFKDKDSFKRGIMSPESLAAAKDLDNFAKGACEVFFVEEQQTAPVPAGR